MTEATSLPRPDVERGLVLTSSGYLHYRLTGAGRPIVMLHTAHRSSEMYLGTMRALADRFRCCAIDFPGCGDSDPPEKRPSIEEYGAGVKEVLGALGLEGVVVLGQALGAFVATEIAASAPDLVRGLVVQNCPFYFSKEFQQQRHAARRSVLSTDETGFPQLLSMADILGKGKAHAPLVPTQEWLDQENVTMIKSGRHYWDGLHAVAEYDLGAALERVACPTLLIWGEGFYYSDQREEFARRVRDHRLVLIPDSGFFPQIDNPDQYLRTITGFMAELSQPVAREQE